MASINVMVKRISGLLDSDLSEWEQDFVESVAKRTRDGEDTTMLTEKQVDVVERIFKKHFAG